jgi:hypothetical protein
LLNLKHRTLPRIFAIRPKPKPEKKEGLWQRMTRQGKAIFNFSSTSGMEEVMLHFYCEAEVPHLAPHEGYAFVRPTDFMRAYGPMVAASLRMLQYSFKVSPLPVGEIIPLSITEPSAKNVYVFNNKLFEYTVSMLESVAGDVEKSKGRDGTFQVKMSEHMQQRFKGMRVRDV